MNRTNALTARILLLIVLLVTGVFSMVRAQGFPEGDKIRVIRDPRVDLLVEKHIRLNEDRNGISGFRIQIFFDSGTNSKTNARTVYENFMARYPQVYAYLTFQAPNYKVRVGDFRTRLDAQRFLNEIISEYPNAWIISEEISLPQVEPLNTVFHE